MRDVFALMKYWVTWPPRHKLRVAQAGYKAPTRPRKFRRGVDHRTDMEHMIEASSRVIPFTNLPDYVQKDLLAHYGNDVTNRNRS